MLALSPKYWARTRESLDARHRAIITPLWTLPSHPQLHALEHDEHDAAAAQ